MNRLTLGIDIDSTIWDSQALYSKAAEELFGHGYSQEDVTHYYWLKEEYGDNYWEIFNKALHPSWIDQRELYPGVVNTLQNIMELGVDIHFVTYNIYPDLMRKPLKKWLQDNFGDVGLSVTGTGDKVPILKRLNAIGIIDDKFETLEEVHNNNMWACAYHQPWNIKQVNDHPLISGFDNWNEGHDVILEEVILGMYSMDYELTC